MLAEALEHLVRGVVDHPDDVMVRDKQTRRGPLLEVRVHPDDLGKVIGRGGRTATAFRTVISALAGKGGSRIDFVDVDQGPLTSDGRPAERHAGLATTLDAAPRAACATEAADPVGDQRGRVTNLSAWTRWRRSTSSWGAIGKPHGLRGEVTVEVRTDEPDRRFAVGTTLRAEAPERPGRLRGRAHRDRRRGGTSPRCCCGSRS